MAKLPNPPAHLPALRAGDDVFAARSGSRWWRIHFAGGPYPASWDDLRYWGPAGARFDHHLPPPRLQSRGIAYLGSSAIVCLAEVFQKTRTVNRRRWNPLLSQIELDRDCDLLDLTDEWPTRAGASQAIATASHSRTRPWARAIHDAYDLGGLVYRSSMHGGDTCLALNERSSRQGRLPARLVHTWSLADPRLEPRLSSAAGRLGYRLW